MCNYDLAEGASFLEALFSHLHGRSERQWDEVLQTYLGYRYARFVGRDVKLGHEKASPVKYLFMFL